jgi:hypothetical protein
MQEVESHGLDFIDKEKAKYDGAFLSASIPLLLSNALFFSPQERERRRCLRLLNNTQL